MKYYTLLTIICLAASGCSHSSDPIVTPVKSGGGDTTFKPPAPEAQAPAPAAITATSFTATWTKAAGADKYLVYVAADNQFSRPLGSYNPATVTDTSLTISNLSAATAYYYRVAASRNGVAGAFSNVVNVITATAKATPTWQPVGGLGISAGGVEYNTAMAVDGNNQLYVAYQDAAYNGAATVLKYTGGSWVPVGTPGFTDNQIGLLAIAIDKTTNIPYIAYRDFDGYFVVEKFVNNGWATVGNSQTLPIAGQPSIAIDNSGNPYIGVIDYNDGDKATVQEFNGNAWVTLGGEGFSEANALQYISIAISADNTIYAAYDDGHGSSVEQYNSGTNGWAFVGASRFNSSTAGSTSLAIGSNGSLYVGYAGSGQIADPECMMYNGSYWAQVGSDFAGSNYYPAFTVDNNSKPILVFQQNTDAYHSLTTEQYTGNAWTTLGNTSFTGGYVGALNSNGIPVASIAVDKNNVVYVAYADDNYNEKVSVMKLVQ